MRGTLLSFWHIAGIGGILLLGSTAIINSYFCPYCFFAYGIAIAIISVDRFV
jgi:hypothetical protein